MKTSKFLSVVILLTVLSLGMVSCNNDKDNEPDDLVTFTLTLLSSNEAMGTVTGGGTYEKDAEVVIEATATKEACVFVKWSDGNTENPRTLTMAENIKLTAEFDYAYVDLGLSVKWATCNVGADSVHHVGDDFAWGETSTKYYYDITSYKWYTIKNNNGVWDIETIIKYNTNNKYGKVDYNTILDAEDDAATVNMGKHWRMPTKDEQEELVAKCIWRWTDNYNETGVPGCIGKSKINGNSIFLPEISYVDYEDYSYHSGGTYWSSTLGINGIDAYLMFFYQLYDVQSFVSSENRYVGIAVRGVCE